MTMIEIEEVRPTNVLTLNLCLRETLHFLNLLRRSLLEQGVSRDLLSYLDQQELRLIWACLHCCPSAWSPQELNSLLNRSQILGRGLGQLQPQG